MFAIPKCLTHIRIYNVTVKHNKFSLSQFTYSGQHVSTLAELSSGPSKICIVEGPEDDSARVETCCPEYVN